MFYKIVRFSLLLAVVYCLALLLGLAMGWFGMTNVLFTIQSVLVTIGLFTFYFSKPVAKDNALLKGINWLIHVLSIPMGVFAALCVTSQGIAGSYWYWINLFMIVFLAVNLITIILNSGIKPFLKMVVSLLGIVFCILIVMQMTGNFNAGKVILYGAIAFVLVTALAVVFGTAKKI